MIKIVLVISEKKVQEEKEKSLLIKTIHTFSHTIDRLTFFRTILSQCITFKVLKQFFWLAWNVQGMIYFTIFHFFLPFWSALSSLSFSSMTNGGYYSPFSCELLVTSSYSVMDIFLRSIHASAIRVRVIKGETDNERKLEGTFKKWWKPTGLWWIKIVYTLLQQLTQF